MPQRWVHSQAQLGDSLTKEFVEASRLMAAFLRDGRWRIVHDPNFESARRRAKEGLSILADKADADTAGKKTFPCENKEHDQDEH